MNYAAIARDGLWRNNAGLVQLLGLCPLLAVTGTAINGLGLGLATLFVVTLSNLVVSLLRHSLRAEIRIPVYVLVIASLVTAVDLAMNAWFHGLYRTLGIFIPLIVTNCAIIGRAEAFASRNPPLASVVDGLAVGAGFAAVLVVLGALREIIGFGTLFAGAELLFGEAARDWQLTLTGYRGFLLAVLPPGAFIGLALLIAGKNWLEIRDHRVAPTVATTVRAQRDASAGTV